MLSGILANKKQEIEESKKNFPLKNFRFSLKNSERDFKQAVTKQEINIIAEIKRKSPSGLMLKNFDIKPIARSYEKSKAAAISVLTDNVYFGSNIINLRLVKNLTTKPLLRKDFIIDPYQVYESRYYGADAILLIARILTSKQINEFIDIANKYHMQALVEVHTEEELNHVLKINAKIIGINNRDLDTLKINMDTTLKLAKKVPKDKIIISESGFQTKKDIDQVRKKVNAVLIGSSLVKERNIKEKIDDLLK